MVKRYTKHSVLCKHYLRVRILPGPLDKEKIMQITKLWLEERDACSSGMEFVEEKQLLGLEGIEFTKKLMEYERYDYANWLIARIMDYEQCIKYAKYAAGLAKKYAASAAENAESSVSAEKAKMAANWTEKAEMATMAVGAAYWAAMAAKSAEKAKMAEDEAMAAYWAKSSAYKEILTYGLQLLEGK